MLFAAGSAERSGDLGRSRRTARQGGLAGGAGALLALLAAGAALHEGPTGAAWLLAWAAVTTSGATSLLPGLAGKPRPAATISTLVLLAGLAAAAVLALGARRIP